MKIFIGMKEIAGHYFNLKKGFDKIGIESRFYNLYEHPFKYDPTDEKNILVTLIRYFQIKRVSIDKKNSRVKYLLLGCLFLLRVALFLFAILKYDVFILGFNSSFFLFYDLPILKFLKKKVIYRFHGIDCRPPYLSGGMVATKENFNVDECILNTRKKKKFLKKVEKYSDIVISNPLLSHLLERPFINATYIGIPIEIDDRFIAKQEEAPGAIEKNNQVYILHAPSDPVVKGTSLIRQEISRLKKMGYPIEYVELKGQPNEVVLKELNKCDFIIDQLYSDTPMAGFNAEAALFSKPAVVGGYAHKEFIKIYPTDKIPPSNYCRPEIINKAIKQLIEDVAYRSELGLKAKKFLENNWTPQQVAKRYVQIIEDKIPAEWWYDPIDIDYIFGAGLKHTRIKEVVRSLVENGGKEVLLLSDKPELERKLMEFAFSETNP